MVQRQLNRQPPVNDLLKLNHLKNWESTTILSCCFESDIYQRRKNESRWICHIFVDLSQTLCWVIWGWVYLSWAERNVETGSIWYYPVEKRHKPSRVELNTQQWKSAISGAPCLQPGSFEYLPAINSNESDDMLFLALSQLRLPGWRWLWPLVLRHLSIFGRSFGAGHSVSPMQPVSWYRYQLLLTGSHCNLLEWRQARQLSGPRHQISCCLLMSILELGNGMGWGGFTRRNNNTIIHVPERTGNTLQNVSMTKQQQQQQHKTVHISFRDKVVKGICQKNAPWVQVYLSKVADTLPCVASVPHKHS